eukprot:6686359-Karenia_brevis.AAC.1
MPPAKAANHSWLISNSLGGQLSQSRPADKACGAEIPTSTATSSVGWAAAVRTSAGRNVGLDGMSPSTSNAAPGSLTANPACSEFRTRLWPLLHSPFAQHSA